MKSSKKVTDKLQIKIKAENFCVYQERSHYEVRNKLYSFGLPSGDIEELISELIQSNFLNEERFAIAYTLGKFRIKHWGKNKIKQGLKLKQVPEKLISKALSQIDMKEYLKTLEMLLRKKAALFPKLDKYELDHRLIQYAAGKGYEKKLIANLLDSPYSELLI
jgi:regulatory protein